jgi:diaminopimelate decarboxylase
MAATESQQHQRLAHVLPLGSRVDARGHLEVGGCDTVELAREFGTPAYVYAEDDLRTRARAYVDAMRARHDDFDVLFASKSFPCTAAYKLFAAEGIACDVASGGELALALRGGFDPARIYLHGNAKSLGELSAAIDSGVGHIVLDSFDDVERLERIARERGMGTAGGAGGQAVLIRVTPGVAGRTHASISTGQADSKFGFGMDDARRAIERLRGSDVLDLQGLHMHIGSQLLSLDAYRPAVEAIATLGEFPVYNLGGGLGVAYTADQQPPSIEEFVTMQVDSANELLGRGKKLLIEPGRSLVANAGVTLYTVQTVKRNVSTWVGVDGGMSDNLRPMLYGSVYEAFLADRAAAAGTGERCHVAGKHCESGDVIVRDVSLDDPKPGDILVTPTTGAYGHAMANNYNGIPRPPVIFCKDGDARVVVRRETYDDLAVRDLV